MGVGGGGVLLGRKCSKITADLFKQEIYRQLPSLPRLITGEVEEGLVVDEVEVE